MYNGTLIKLNSMDKCVPIYDFISQNTCFFHVGKAIYARLAAQALAFMTLLCVCFTFHISHFILFYLSFYIFSPTFFMVQWRSVTPCLLCTFYGNTFFLTAFRVTSFMRTILLIKQQQLQQ